MAVWFIFLQGARVWVPHPDLVWEGGEVIEDYSVTNLKVKTDSGKVICFDDTCLTL